MKARTRSRSSRSSGLRAKPLTRVGSQFPASERNQIRLGLQLNYDNPAEAVALAQQADRLGFDSAWTSEAYGSDAVSVLAWVAATTSLQVGSAIMQMPARTPATTAATAATLDLLSEGRVMLGLGTSGPQVVEGWHGQPWGRPLARTREYVEIVRAILRREEPLEHHGREYEVPYAGPGATGLGKPLKLILRPLRPAIPIYLAAIGPKNVALAAEIAEGWLPIFFSPDRFEEVFRPALDEGFARRADGAERSRFDLAALVPIVVGDDVEECRNALKPMLALYVGGMGARGRNFYTALAARYGYEEEARRVQELFLEGKRAEAVAAVPDGLVDEVALVGPGARIAERLEAWRACGVSTLICQTRQPEALELMAELVA